MIKNITRRALMSCTAGFGTLSLFGTSVAAVVRERLPWKPGLINAPAYGISHEDAKFLTQEEKATLKAIADRFIPADELSISGSEAGCVEFIDRQLSGPYGRAASMYRLGRFIEGTPEQGTQLSSTPAERYRSGLRDLKAYCQKTYRKTFETLPAETQDSLLSDLENGKIDFPSMKGKIFFEQVLQNVREGYLADPIYGGNKDMASWVMVGFPGARYDYRDYMDIKNKDLKLKPVSLLDKIL